MVNLDLNYEGFEKYLVEKKDRTMYGKPGVQYKFLFNNEFGASVIKCLGNYGYELDLWELAVYDRDGDLCYSTPITDDVLGYLTDDEIRKTLKQIQEL